jgi:hypothetical protein
MNTLRETLLTKQPRLEVIWVTFGKPNPIVIDRYQITLQVLALDHIITDFIDFHLRLHHWIFLLDDLSPHYNCILLVEQEYICHVIYDTV